MRILGDHKHHTLRAFLYGGLAALFFFQSQNFSFEAEAPIFKRTLTAQVSEVLSDVPKAININESTLLEFPTDISARAFFLGRVDIKNNSIEAIFEKNSKEAFPIASITKLMTVFTALDYFDDRDVLLMPNDIEKELWSSKRFLGDERISFGELVKASLIESNNDAVRVIARSAQVPFIEKMNQKARAYFLTSMRFSNETGIDPGTSAVSPNISSAEDVARLLTLFFQKEKDIASISSLQSSQIFLAGNVPYYTAYNTNEFAYIPAEGLTLLSSKTGTTDLAKRNLVVLTQDKFGVLYVAVTLGSSNAFDDTRAILSHIKSY